jgi:hypothetical protein
LSQVVVVSVIFVTMFKSRHFFSSVEPAVALYIQYISIPPVLSICLSVWLCSIFFSGVGLSPLGTAATCGLLYKPKILWANWWKEDWQRNPKYSEKTYPSVWDLWWTKWRRGRFSPSTSVSPANLHSTNCSTIILIYHLGFVQ